ncbi:OmpW family outer membrane protein [uncultured Halovibrio sp.]|uniref:OmpW/AlkL family protein n=1 Tax=uncultured Halovibrio sp. TaxID=985049 RepID=UPI0025F265B5|nr:OmpW family outer membrane protein [uncultured Halovibrio sp.]
MKLNPIRQSLIAALSISVIGAAAPALAYDKGDTIVRGGIASVVPGGSYSSDLNLRADSDIQAGASISYMMTDNMSVNLLAATPFEHDIEMSGAGTIGSTKHLPPTVTVSWFPLAGQNLAFKPYIGAGVNYTTFFDESLDGSNASLKLDDSIGPAAQVGVDVPLDESWSVGAAAYYADIDTDLTVAGKDQGTVEIDPMIYRLHVGYSF